MVLCIPSSSASRNRTTNIVKSKLRPKLPNFMEENKVLITLIWNQPGNMNFGTRSGRPAAAINH